MAGNRKIDDVTVVDALEQAALDNGILDPDGWRVRKLSRGQMAELVGAGMTAARLGSFRTEQGPSSPTLTEAVCVANEFYLSLEEIADRRAPLLLFERNGLFWRLAGVPRGTRPRACRIAAARAVAGHSQDEIRDAVRVVYAGRDRHPLSLDEASIRDMVQAGLDMGLVRFEVSPEGATGAFEDEDLAGELANALEDDPKARRGDRAVQRPRVRVVKNVVDSKSFALDPVMPFLIARVAHGIVERHLLHHPDSYSIGLAGGMHCSAFVRSTGAESSPFPDDSGDKRIAFLPLTLEPFSSHQLPMADAVVGQMVSQARCLLGARRVDGLTFQSFGYIVDEKLERPHGDMINQVRNGYRGLDVAVFGCGDLESDGWLEQILRGVTIAPGASPATDVCLNLLDEEARPIPLSKGREFVGISLADIRRLVDREDRLAVLLTSGPAKGLPLVVASRAGCADTIVCDQAAARAALEVLAHS